MDEFTSLKKLRSEVPQRQLGELSSAFNPLSTAMAAAERNLEREAERATTHPRLRDRFTKPLIGWSTAAAAFAVTLGVIAAQILAPAPSAIAAEILQQTASQAITYTDLDPNEGEYLKITYLTHDAVGYDPSTGEYETDFISRIINYVPGTSSAPWVEQFRAVDSNGVATDQFDVTHTTNGFDWDPDILDRFEQIPTGSAQETYEYFDAQYRGGSSSRDEDNYVRIVDILRTGIVPSGLRAALLNALALVPGVEVSEKTTNELGIEAYGFSRSESKRDDERTEILINPDSGLFVGERIVSTDGEVLYSSAKTYEIVDAAPSE